MTDSGHPIPAQRPVAGGSAPVEPAVYTVEEAAALLGVARTTAYELVRDCTIPARRLGGRWVISRARFHAWLDSDPVTAGEERS